MRRWLWPYAILAVLLLLIGMFVVSYLIIGLGPDRAGAQISAASASVLEPVMTYVSTMIAMIAPFDMPPWLQNLYAILVMIAVVGIGLSLTVGLLLLPIFYALYRQRGEG